MRTETIMGPVTLGIAVAAVPGASLAVQVVAVALAIAPALVHAARAGTEQLRSASPPRKAAGGAAAPPAAERSER